FTVIKWIGAAYLVWMGVKLLRSRPVTAAEDDAAPAPKSARRIFGHACLVTALNPKSIAFFIAFVPQFITPGAPLGPQFATLIATFVSLATLNALSYALLADKLRRQIREPAVLRWMNRAGGGALVGMGVMTATLTRG
ncbi:LysE family translocator, partial [Thioclava sp. BHET1]